MRASSRRQLTECEIQRQFYDLGWDTLRIANHIGATEAAVYNALHRFKERLLAEVEDA